MSRIVIADDDPNIGRILRDRLNELGHDVVHVLDGVEALRLAEGADLLLLDLEMPRMDGFAVLEPARLARRAAGDRHHRPWRHG